MQDRVPLYPGRVKMTPVAGQANTFDMVRADDPTQAGTPINKATLLKDATAALFGKTNAAVPDDILDLLSKSVLAQTVGGDTSLTDVLGNLIQIPARQVADRVQIETGSYVGTGTYGQDNPNTLTFGFAPKFLIIAGLFEYPSREDYRGFAFLGPYGGLATPNNRYWNDSAQSLNSVFAEVSGNTISWYKNNALYQMNDPKITYFYVAIG